MAHALHPQLPAGVEAVQTYGGCWPADKPFPLSPEECMALVMGYAVQPRQPMSWEDIELLPGQWESGRHGIVLHRS